MKKRLISILLAAAMSFGVIGANAIEPVAPDKNNSVNTPEKIESDLYAGGSREAAGEVFYKPGKNTVSSEVKFFMDLGLIDHYYPDMALQRNALKKLLNIVYGYDGVYEKYFPETDSEKKTLTYDEALTAFMDLTGYAKFAELEGGKIENYYSIASRYGLLDNVKTEAARKKLTAEEFVKMAHNALTVDMVNVMGNNFAVQKGKTAMYEYLHLTEVGGVVRANSYTTLNGADGAGDGKIRIETTIYDVELKDDADEYLGYSVTAYKDKNDTIVSMSVNENRNTLKEFDNDSDIENSSSKENFVYYENDRKKTLRIDRYANLVYNYVPCTDYTSDFYPIKNGTMKLIDNNGDGVYDVVLKKEYTSFVPYSRSSNDNTVSDKNGYVYDLTGMIEDEKYRGIRTLSGEEMSFDYITTTIPISLLKKWNSNVVTELIILEKTTFEGQYKSYDSADDTYTIGDKEFKLAEVYSSSNGGKFPFDLGANVMVYLDHMGRIVNGETTTLSYKYAWLVGMVKEGIGENVRIKAFTQDAVMKTYDVKDKVELNGKRIDSYKLLSDTSVYLGGNVIEQLIKYKVNEDGVIVGIKTASKNNCGLGKYKSLDSEDLELNLDYWDKVNAASSDEEKANYRLWYTGNGMNALGGKYHIDADKTIIFGIPSTKARNENGDRAFSVRESFNNEERYTVNLYDVDEEYNVGAATYQVNSIKNDYIDFGWGASVVTSVTEELDKGEDEPLTYVYTSGLTGWESVRKQHPDFGDLLTCSPLLQYGFKNDSQKRVLYESVKKMSDLKKGTVCLFNTNGGYVVQFTPLFIYDDTRPQEEQYFEFNALENWGDYKKMYDDDGNLLPNHAYDYAYVYGVTKQTFYGKDVIGYGKVIRKCYDGFVFNAHIGEADQEEWNRRIFALPTRVAMLFDTKKQKLEQITFADIQAGDNVFIQMNNGNAPGVVVYR